MPTKIPSIPEVIDFACRKVKSPRGHDVSASEGRAFLRQFFFEVLRMPPVIMVKFIAKCLIYYGREMKKK